jgi:hypothetical protein
MNAHFACIAIAEKNMAEKWEKKLREECYLIAFPTFACVVIAGREEFAANGKEDCVNNQNLSDECSCAWIAIPGKNFCSRKWERRR